jgi:RraA family protein
MPVGFRIFSSPAAPDAALLEAFRGCATAHLADSMSHLRAACSALVPRHRSTMVLCGPALTVRAAPGDNLMAQKAIDMARPGDVIVIDVGGFTDQAVVGEIMAEYAAARGVAGFVVDGAVRDSHFLAEFHLPVYARGVTPRGPSKVGPGEINGPVSIGGMVVHPGDIVVGDSDGVVAVPMCDAREVLAAVDVLQQREVSMLEAISARKLDRRWIDAALVAGGCVLPQDGPK